MAPFRVEFPKYFQHLRGGGHIPPHKTHKKEGQLAYGHHLFHDIWVIILAPFRGFQGGTYPSDMRQDYKCVLFWWQPILKTCWHCYQNCLFRFENRPLVYKSIRKYYWSLCWAISGCVRWSCSLHDNNQGQSFSDFISVHWDDVCKTGCPRKNCATQKSPLI